MDKLQTVTSAPVSSGDPLNAPKIRGNDLEKASQQFEAIFLRNMLKEMRKVNELFDSKDNPFNSDSVRMMQGFYDDTLCNTLSQHHGIGIAEMIVKQLSPHHSEQKT
ncbi:rod-binding protein [Enterobacteriaceae bacterium RIT711]|uniref:rod-binding protein n=1 Tax=Buttiauxella gaviniae TaxID=82990 RepID=UPI0012AD94D3|nr:rod-binding protein [Enterobacteriaceae bacterium RIT711]